MVTQENTAEDRGLSIRQSFLKYPGEAPEIDYKDAVKFIKGDEFCLKLIKHILGIANSGGGYIVIGFKENENKHPEALQNISADVVASYDPSILAQCVESYKAGSEKIDIFVHKDKHPDNNLIFPIIQIGGFKKRPFFCKSSASGILQEGALYIRIPGSRTIKVASPDEWDQLIDICVSRQQDNLLKRFAVLTRELGVASNGNIAKLKPETDSSPEFLIKKMDPKKWIDGQEKKVKELVGKTGNKFEGFEVSHWILDNIKSWDHKELLEASERSVLRNTGWPIGLVMHTPDAKPKPETDGISVTISSDKAKSFWDGFDYWSLHNDGSFYLFREAEEETRAERSDRVIFFDTRIWRIAEAIKHCTELYKNLGLEPSNKIMIRIKHLGLNGRILTASDPGRAFTMFKRTAGTDSITWEKEVSLDYINSNFNSLVADSCKKLFLMFDFWVPADNIIDEITNQFLKSRVG
jgi:hypothetical protein